MERLQPVDRDGARRGAGMHLLTHAGSRRRVARPVPARTRLHFRVTVRRSVITIVAVSLVMACEATPRPSSPPTTPTRVAATHAAPTSAASPAALRAAFHWRTPDDGSTVEKSRLMLRATADGVVDGAMLTFSVDWPGSAAKPVCTAVAARKAAWTCVVDLVAIHAPRGPLVVRFDVDRGDG